MRQRSTTTKILKWKKTGNSKCWPGCGTEFSSCWWEDESLETLWKTDVSTEVEHMRPQDPVILLLGIYPTEISTHVQYKLGIRIFIHALFIVTYNGQALQGLSDLTSLYSPPCSLRSILVGFLAISRTQQELSSLSPLHLLFCLHGSLLPWSSSLQLGCDLAPQGTFGMSGDGFDEHAWGAATGIWWVSARDAVKHPTVHRTGPHNGEFPRLECPRC